MFHLLQSERRHALCDLVDRGAPVDTRTCSASVAAAEYRTTVDRPTADQRQRVSISLYQSRLSKLDEYGIVEYDRSRGVVRPTARTDELTVYLSTGTADGDGRGRSPTYYLLLSVASTLVLAATWYEVSFSRSILGPRRSARHRRFRRERTERACLPHCRD